MFEFCIDWLPATVSAFFAGLTFVFSQMPSSQERLEILKIKILDILEDSKKSDEFISKTINYDYSAKEAGKLLGKKYSKKKWSNLIRPAVVQLKNSGYTGKFESSSSQGTRKNN